MKRVLFKIILPAGLLAAWMLTCYPVCNKADGFDVFLYWILVGCPYGLRKMCMILVPKNFGIAGSMGILALNCVVGGLIGGVVAIWREDYYTDADGTIPTFETKEEAEDYLQGMEQKPVTSGHDVQKYMR